jgi:hypothetical protein
MKYVAPVPTPWTPFMWQSQARMNHFSAFFSRPNGLSALNFATGNAHFRVVISAISAERLSCHSALYNIQNNDFIFNSLELSELFSAQKVETHLMIRFELSDYFGGCHLDRSLGIESLFYKLANLWHMFSLLT